MAEVAPIADVGDLDYATVDFLSLQCKLSSFIGHSTGNTLSLQDISTELCIRYHSYNVSNQVKFKEVP